VAGVEHRAGEDRRTDRKRLVHPSLGVIELSCLSLFSEDGRLRLLSVIGSQDLGAVLSHPEGDRR
jgi:hypothetical protein